MPAVRTLELTKDYGDNRALDCLNLEIAEGSVYALVGPNGAGKTTALKILMNLQQPTGGSAEVLGLDSRRLRGRDFSQIGYVSENQDMPEWMTIVELLEYLKPFYPAWDDARCDELVRQLELPLMSKIKHLSRGERMKASLASSLAYRPKLIVLDEPFSGLDALMRDQLIEALLAAVTESTVVISSHDLAEIESFASHVGYLHRGRLEFSEDLASLESRFREVEVTADAAPPPARLPREWLRVQTAGQVTRFVDPHFDADRLSAAVRELFGETSGVSFRPMALREIFVALARSSGRAA